MLFIKYKPFAKLRGKIAECGYNMPEISQEIGLGKYGLSQRVRCAAPFRMFEIYRLCAAIGIPFDKILEYFPPEDCEEYEKRQSKKKEEKTA